MENTVDFTKIWGIIQKLEIISIVTNSFLLISLIYTFLIASPKYEASTQVLVNEKEKVITCKLSKYKVIFN